MKQKSGIFWWWRRRRPRAIYIPRKEEEQKVPITPKEENNNTNMNEEEKNTTITPLPIIDDIKKEKERVIPTKKNERVTLIKPKRTVGIENPVEEFIEDNPKKKERKQEEKINKSFIDEETILNDVSIKIDTLDEIEKMLRTNYEEIQNIKYELEVLEQREEDEVITAEIERLIEELNQLIKKFESIKKEFYQKNFEDIYNHSTSDTYIGQLIEEYRNTIKENNSSEELLQGIVQIEEYISLINEIIEIETKKDDVSKKLDNKKEKLGIRDSEFENLKANYSNVEKMNNYIEGFSLEYNHIINDIEAKVAKSENITKTAEYKSELVVNHTRLLASTLLLASTPMIPFTRGGNILKMGLMMAAVTGIATSVRLRTRESKVTTSINFTDYAKEIQASINNVQDMSLMIDKTRLDIKSIREEFQKEFAEYVDLIPEYHELMSNLDSIEKDLLVKSSIAKEYDKKLETVLEENNVKVKRLEEEIIN